jgi:hypothetical protein
LEELGVNLGKRSRKIILKKHLHGKDSRFLKGVVGYRGTFLDRLLGNCQGVVCGFIHHDLNRERTKRSVFTEKRLKSDWLN